MSDDEYVEAVARRLCELRGMDPDGFVPDILLYSPRWTLVANEVRARMQLDEALRLEAKP